MAFLIGERPQEIARRAVPKQNRTVTGASRDRAIRRGYRESTDSDESVDASSIAITSTGRPLYNRERRQGST